MKAYKGFNKDMTCRGFQFKEGETYEEDSAKLCQRGFHACERPLDVFGYYHPSESEYHIVELEDVSDERHSDDTKVCGKKIKIGAKLSVKNLVDAQFEFVREHCTNENNAECGKAASAGASGAASAGEFGAASAGASGAAVSRGTASVEKYGIACVRGNNCRVRGGLNSVLVIAEENLYNCEIANWKAVVVDGETVKADTWYTLRDGELVEVQDEG